MILERILGSRAKVALLRALFEHDNTTGRALSAAAGVSSSTGKAALDDLRAAGVVLQSGTPSHHQYELNHSHWARALLEHLFQFECAIPRKIAEFVHRIAGPHSLRGVVVENGTVVLYGTSALTLDLAARKQISRTLAYSFGLSVASIFTNDPAPAAGPGRWVLCSSTQTGPRSGPPGGSPYLDSSG